MPKKRYDLENRFRALIIVGVVLFLAALFLLLVPTSFCPPDNDEWTAQTYQYSAPADYGTEQRGQIVAQKRTPERKRDNLENEYGKRAIAVLCSVKVTDLALVLLTYFLVVVGWFTARSADELRRRSERAYVFGGGPFGATKPKWVQALRNEEVFREAKHFSDPRRMTIYNHGRTAAFITRVEWGFCENLPKGMRVSEAIDSEALKPDAVDCPSDVYPPAGSGERPFYLYRHVEIPRRADHEGQIFYGRIWYKDIFHETHYSTFSLRLTEGHADPVGQSYSDDWN